MIPLLDNLYTVVVQFPRLTTHFKILEQVTETIGPHTTTTNTPTNKTPTPYKHLKNTDVPQTIIMQPIVTTH
jgi:hypothetical protein